MTTRKNQFFPQSIPHPGGTLAEKFAIRTGKPEKTITAILEGDSSITPDMAVQFENVNYQKSYKSATLHFCMAAHGRASF